MIINGNLIAENILTAVQDDVHNNNLNAHLVIITNTDDVVGNTYVDRKKNKAEQIGIKVTIEKWPPNILQEDAESLLLKTITNNSRAGIVLQLPLPSQLNLSSLVKLIPQEQDVDGLRYLDTTLETLHLPAVIDAILEVIYQEKLDLKNKNIVIVGSEGKLVGRPLSRYFNEHNIEFTGVDTETLERNILLKDADIIISAVGKKHIIDKNDIKKDAVIIDVGFTIDAGKIYGDVNPNVSKKTDIFTPVPGGIGPITIAILLRNVVDLAKLS